MLTKNHTLTLNTMSAMDMVVIVTTTVTTTVASTVQATIPMPHLRIVITVTIIPPTLKKRIPLTNF
jgi:hypothetical protein